MLDGENKGKLSQISRSQFCMAATGQTERVTGY